MLHRGRVIWQGICAALVRLAGVAIAAAFIGVSGFASVTFGYQMGEPSGNGLLFAVFALGVEGFADLAVPLFWHRLRLIGRTILLGFFVVCLGYKLTAANRFAAENLSQRETAAATATTDYDTARDKVEALRRTIADNVTARQVTVIEAEIRAQLRDPRAEGCEGKINGKVTGEVCPKVDSLRTELARAKARDQAAAELTPAIAALRGKTGGAAPVAQDDLGVVGSVLALAGWRPAGFSDLVAHLFMAIVESGAIIVPMLLGLAYGEGRRSAPAGEARAGSATGEAQRAAAIVETLPAPVTSPPQGLPDEASSLGQLGMGNAPRRRKVGRVAPAGETPNEEASPPVTDSATAVGEAREAHAGQGLIAERDRGYLAGLAAFLDGPCERHAGDRVQASTLYFLYSDWHQQQGGQPMSMAKFGTLMTQRLGFAKSKIVGKNHYLGIWRRDPAQGGAGLAGARAWLCWRLQTLNGQETPAVIVRRQPASCIRPHAGNGCA
jgi:hypothetical protein